MNLDYTDRHLEVRETLAGLTDCAWSHGVVQGLTGGLQRRPQLLDVREVSLHAVGLEPGGQLLAVGCEQVSQGLPRLPGGAGFGGQGGGQVGGVLLPELQQVLILEDR